MHTAELGKTPQVWPVVVGWGGIYFQSVTLLVGLAWEVEVGVVGGVYLVGGRWEWWELWEGSRRIEQLATGRNAPDLASAFRHAHAQHVGSSDAGLGWVNPVSSMSEKVQSHAVGWKIPIVLQYI